MRKNGRNIEKLTEGEAVYQAERKNKKPSNSVRNRSSGERVMGAVIFET